MIARSLINCACLLGEGPVWHQSRLWWVDIQNQKLFSWDPDGTVPGQYTMPEKIGFAVPTDGPEWAVGLDSGIYLWNPEGEALKLLYAPEKDCHNSRFNDGKCDPQGRLWAGTMNIASPGEAALYRVGKGGNGCRMLPGITISNGLAWNIGRRELYYIDTKTTEVSAYAFDPESGEISNRRVIISFPAESGAPDGMTIDGEGMLWVALWGGFGVVRIDPVEGRILTKVEVPAPHVTSCTFGSDGLDTLYITTARIGMSEEKLEQYPQSGNIFCVEPGVAGLPVTLFRR